MLVFRVVKRMSARHCLVKFYWDTAMSDFSRCPVYHLVMSVYSRCCVYDTEISVCTSRSVDDILMSKENLRPIMQLLSQPTRTDTEMGSSQDPLGAMNYSVCPQLAVIQAQVH